MHDHRFDFRRHPAGGANLRKSRRCFGGMGEQHVHRLVADERQSAGQQFEQDDADAVQIAAIIGLLASHLFRRDVARRADGEIDAGVRLVVHHADVAGIGDQLGEAEIHDLDFFVRGIGIDDHQVGGLQVAVNDSLGMGGVEGLAQLVQNLADPRRRESAVTVHQGIEADAAHVFHDDARAERIIQGSVIEGDNVGMLKASHQQHFPLKTLTKLGIAGNMLVHDLDNDLPSEIGLLGQVDTSHPPFAEELDGLISTKEGSAGHDGNP